MTDLVLHFILYSDWCLRFVDSHKENMPELALSSWPLPFSSVERPYPGAASPKSRCRWKFWGCFWPPECSEEEYLSEWELWGANHRGWRMKNGRWSYGLHYCEWIPPKVADTQVLKNFLSSWLVHSVSGDDRLKRNLAWPQWLDKRLSKTMKQNEFHNPRLVGTPMKVEYLLNKQMGQLSGNG